MLQLRLIAIAIVLFVLAPILHAENVAAPPTDEVLDAVQDRLDTFKMRDDGKHHTPEPGEERLAKQRERIQAEIAALDAREIQSTGVLRLTALVLSGDDLRALSQLTGIRSVYFMKCTITVQGFAHIANAWQGSLTQLGLNYVDVVGDGSIAPSFAKLDKLTWLALTSASGIGMDVIHVLSESPIEMLDMNRNSGGIPPTELLPLLETSFTALRKLDLHHWKKFRDEREALYEKRPELEKQKRLERYFGIVDDAQ